MFRLDPEKDKEKLEGLRDQCVERELLELKMNFGPSLGNKEVIVYAKKPTRALFKRFRAKAKSDHSSALEELVSACILYPDGTQVQALFEKWPGLIDTFAEPLFDAIGLNQTADIETKNS